MMRMLILAFIWRDVTFSFLPTMLDLALQMQIIIIITIVCLWSNIQCSSVDRFAQANGGSTNTTRQARKNGGG